METEITDIGKVAITPRKDYKNEQTYEWLDVVTYNGASYMCIAEDGCTGIVPTNTDYWQLLADKGHFTEEDKEEFKKAVVEESKTEINEHTGNKKTELNNYTTELEKSLKNELDTFETEKEVQLDLYKATLETEMSNKKDELVKKIEDAQSGFDTNVATKTKKFDDNVTAKINDFDTNAQEKTTEYDNNATAKLEEYNNNSKAKIEEFNAKAESYNNRITELETEVDELSENMPWQKTDISESLHIEDSAKYSRNKLDVFGNLKQETRSGKNLCDNSKYNDGIYYSFNNETITLLKKDTRTSSQINDNEKITLPSGTYTITIYDITYSHSIQFIVFSGDIIRNINGNSGTFTLTQETTFFIKPLIGLPSEVTLPIKFKIQIELGSASTEYEQFGAMPSIDYPSMPVVATGVQIITKCEKNLIPYPYVKESSTIHGVEFNANSDGSIDIKGTSTNSACDFYLFGQYNDKGKYLKLKKGEYSLKNQKNVLYIARERSLGPLFGDNIVNALAKQDCYFYSFLLRIEKEITIDTTFYPQLELSPITTDYEPYSEEVFELDLEDKELTKIKDSDGNVVAQDKFVFKDSKWQIERNVGKMILNEKNTWQKGSSSNAEYTLFQRTDTTSEELTNQKIAVCDKFRLKDNLDISSDKLKFESIYYNVYTNYRARISIKNSRLTDTTIEAFKLWLKDNNITNYYVRKTPTYEDCTDAQAEVLDKLHKLQLAQGTNNIFVESENGVTAELQLEYMQDRIMLENAKDKKYNDRITAIENLLSTTATSAMLLDNLETDLESEVK